jgi:hypothetical protein
LAEKILVELSYHYIKQRAKQTLRRPDDSSSTMSSQNPLTTESQRSTIATSSTGTSEKIIMPGEEKELQQELKFDHYLGKEIDEKEYELQKRNNNDKFVETVRINNVYNRLILFEGGEYHGVPTFYSDESEERLTQVFFVNALNSQDPYPIVRSKLRY